MHFSFTLSLRHKINVIEISEIPPSSLRLAQMWMCEFCGCENSVNDGVQRVCVGQRAGVHTDDLYLPSQSDDDYQNLEDTLVVFCVDISGSMSVTTEVCVQKTYSDHSSSSSSSPSSS